MKTLITNGIVVTMNPQMDVYPDGYVLIEDECILQTGPMAELDKTMPGQSGLMTEPAGAVSEHAGRQSAFGGELQIRDARRAIIMPGMVNTHTHLGMIPFRGLGDDCVDRLRVFLLPMEERAMSAEMAEKSARYAICELLLAGVTTVFDMYYFEDRVAQAMDEMGIRGIAAETVMDASACDFASPEDAIAFGGKFIQRYRNHPRISGALAPHGTSTVSPEYLKAAYEIDHANGVPFTLHAAEMDYEITELRKRYGCTPMGFLNRIDVLHEDTLAAHSILLTKKDIALMGERGCSVAHCIASNTKAAKGVAPVLAMREAGIAAGLGTDGPASGNTLDLFTQMRLCENFHKNENRDRTALPAKEVVRMATIEGARAMGLSAVTGSIEPGKAADLVLVETDSANMFPVYDPYSALVYSANSSNVRDVYVAGKLLAKEKKLTCADLSTVRAELKECMAGSAFAEYRMLP